VNRRSGSPCHAATPAGMLAQGFLRRSFFSLPNNGLRLTGLARRRLERVLPTKLTWSGGGVAWAAGQLPMQITGLVPQRTRALSPEAVRRAQGDLAPTGSRTASGSWSPPCGWSG
jgi:hypothetical protein